jgi:ATP-binding cassette subfamily B protein
LTSNALLRLWPFARPYARGLAISTLAGVGMIGAGLTIPKITGAVVDDLKDGRTSRLLFFTAAVLVMGALEAVLAHLRRSIGATAAIGMERDLRNEFYAHLQRLPVAFHDGWQSGQLLSRLIHDLGTIRRFIGFGMIFLFLNVLQFAVVSVILVRSNAGLTLFTAVTAVLIIVMTFVFNMRYHLIARKVQDDQGDLTTTIEESLTGIRIIKAFGRGGFVGGIFRRGADVLHTSNMEAVRLRAFFWSVLRLLPDLNILAVLGLGARSVVNGSMTAGELTAFIFYLQMMAWPIRSIGWILANAEEARTGAERLFEVLDTPPAIADSPGARALTDGAGRIAFEDVSFTYPETQTEILHDVSLEIVPGERLALVGVTGCGKTTLASLVPRLYDVSSGRVTIDGIDVREVTLSSLRAQIGVAFEDPVLFSMSVRENMLLGDPDATEDSMRAALETANATFVYELPWGLDTRIGEQGYSLSGGQRQRLALARAVLRTPRVLVLDDPLSSVDVHTEAQIEEALAKVLVGRTALLVVHRPSTLALADRVALIHDGSIADVGTHHELMERNALYRDVLSMEAVSIEAGEVSGELR